MRPRFSNGRSSRSSVDTGVRSSGSSKTAWVRSKGSSSARSPSTELVSLDTGSTGAGAASISGAPGSVGGLRLRVHVLRLLGQLLQERVLLELLAHDLLELERGELQQLDRLLEERGHHDPLGLAKGQAHGSGGSGRDASEREFLAEVDLAGLGVVRQLAGRAGGQDLAVVQDVRAVRDRERLADVVVGDQHSDTAVLEPADDLLDVADGDRVDAGERLVEEQVPRVRDERARDLEAPPLAARERVGLVAREPGEIQLGQERP